MDSYKATTEVKRMAVFLASYDLHKPDRNYQPLYDYLETFNYAHCIGSVWLLDTNLTSAEIRDGMQKHMHEKDTTLVIRLQYEAAWHNYEPCGAWILDDARNW